MAESARPGNYGAAGRVRRARVGRVLEHAVVGGVGNEKVSLVVEDEALREVQLTHSDTKGIDPCHRDGRGRANRADPVTAFWPVVVVVPAPAGATSGERLNNMAATAPTTTGSRDQIR